LLARAPVARNRTGGIRIHFRERRPGAVRRDRPAIFNTVAHLIHDALVVVAQSKFLAGVGKPSGEWADDVGQAQGRNVKR
jgi:hypothetical protein